METMVYETPAYKIGKHEWKLIVIECDDALVKIAPGKWTIGKGRFTRFLWRRDYRYWFKDSEHPNYNEHDGAWAGLPHGLKKIYEKHEAEIKWALELHEDTKTQMNMFQSGEDLPLFSNTPIKADTKSYKPRSVEKQPKLPTLCPLCLNTRFIDGKKCICVIEEQKP